MTEEREEGRGIGRGNKCIEEEKEKWKDMGKRKKRERNVGGQDRKKQRKGNNKFAQKEKQTLK